MSSFVTLVSFDNVIDAHILKGLLESEQIPVFLLREHFFASQKLFNVALADIRLQVPPEDFLKASRLLEDFRRGVMAEPLIEFFELQPSICKKCSSHDIGVISARPSLVFGALIQMFLIGLVLPPSKFKICNQCKTRSVID